MSTPAAQASPPSIASSNASSELNSGTKRKRVPDQKFYAVRVGAKPGIYYTYADCLDQVRGHKNASFKSFTSVTEAESFIANGLAVKSQRSGSSQKFYAVRNGRRPGIYLDWPSAQQQIIGWSKPRHKSFTTRADAEAFMQNSETSTALDEEPKRVPQKRLRTVHDIGDEDDHVENGHGIIEPGTAPLPSYAVDGFDDRVILSGKTGQIENKSEKQLNATKMQAQGSSQDALLRIYTDGSALGNGRLGSTAGVGVYFGPSDTRNVSEALAGPRQTNQRAELTAILRAIEIAPRNHHIIIHTDSEYSINCVTKWFQGWRERGWQTASRKPVENKDLIENIVNKIEERHRFRVKTEFQWVKGHANDPGNVVADQLAVNGARESRISQS